MAKLSFDQSSFQKRETKIVETSSPIIVEKIIEKPGEIVISKERDYRLRKHLMNVRQDLLKKIDHINKKEVDLSELYKTKIQIEGLKVHLCNLEEKDKQLLRYIQKIETDLDILLQSENPVREIVVKEIVQPSKLPLDKRMLAINLILFITNLTIIFLMRR